MENNKKIKTIFMGTPDFAVTILGALVNDPAIEIVGVFTQPDRPVGRKQTITPSAVKVFATKKGIAIYQPEKISNIPVLSRAEGQYPISNIDIIIVAAYAQILPKSILELPKYGCINVHGSLLPKYRGASCVAAAIRDGETETGVTIMKMDEGLDTGPILAQKSIPIAANETAGTLTAKLADLGASLLIPTIKEYITGNIEPRTQDNNLATYAPVLKKSDGRIDLSKSAVEVERFIRAMQPWPGAWCELRVTSYELRVKIIEADNKPITSDNTVPGNLFVHEDRLAMQLGDGALVINKIQPEGKKALSGEEFIRGYMI